MAPAHESVKGMKVPGSNCLMPPIYVGPGPFWPAFDPSPAAICTSSTAPTADCRWRPRRWRSAWRRWT